MSGATVLVLETGDPPEPVRARHGDFVAWVEAGLGSDVSVRALAAHRGEPLTSAGDFDGVVVTGSPAMVSERAPWSEAASRWLADLVEADEVPVLGICYGHQLIAHGLGGEVGPNPNGREMGTIALRVEAPVAAPDALEPLFDAGVVPAHFSHVESVLRPPSGALVLGQTSMDPHSVLRFGPRQWGVQFHPEFDRLVMQGYVEVRREALSREGIDPDALIREARDTPVATSVLARFAESLGAA